MPDQKLSPFVRPQTAVGAKTTSASITSPSPHKAPDTTFRPWTTHSPGQRQKVLRPSQTLRQSHLKATRRKKRGSSAKNRGEGAELAQATSNAVTSSLECPDEGVELEVVTMVGRGDEPDCATQVTEVRGTRPPGKPYLTFGTWVTGSPHDSEEYDTDLEEQDTPTESQSRPPDASGLNVYEDQCKKRGLVPVSYIRRHLGKRSIRMRHHYLGGDAARALAYAFRHNTITELVDLSDNYLQCGGAVYMAAMLKDNSFLVSLDLSNNFIGSSGCAALAEMLDVNTTLKTLNLAGNQLSDADMHHFIDPLKNNLSLSSLDLSHNNLGPMAGIHLAAVLSVNDGLNDLDLSWNSIRREGAVALANALKVNTVLEVLDLSWNGVGREGVGALHLSLQANTSLRVLDLTNNRIDVQSAHKLAAGLKNNFGLETLLLNVNPLKDEGIESLLHAAATHRSLKFLSLENCGELQISKDNFQRIQDLEDSKGVIILHGGTGGYHRNTGVMTVLRLLSRFCREHWTDLESSLLQQDKDHQGWMTAEETKQCLRQAGLRLTHRQLDLLIDEIDFAHSGRIQYGDILSGKLFEEYHRRRPSRGFSLSPTAAERMLPPQSQDGGD